MPSEFEENRTPFLYLVINETNQWGLVFAFIYTKDVYLSDFQFCFRFHELMSWSVAIILVIHRQLTFRSSLHLEESSCSSNMKIWSGNHTAVKQSPSRKLGHYYVVHGILSLSWIDYVIIRMASKMTISFNKRDQTLLKSIWRTVVYELWRIFDWIFVCFKLLTSCMLCSA